MIQCTKLEVLAMLDLIKAIINEKTINHEIPNYCCMLNIKSKLVEKNQYDYVKVKACINELVKQKKVIHGKTLNDKYFIICE